MILKRHHFELQWSLVVADADRTQAGKAHNRELGITHMRKGLKGFSFVGHVLFCLIVVFTLYTSVQPGGMPDRALSPTVLLDG